MTNDILNKPESVTQDADGSDEDGGRVPENVLVLACEATLPYLIDKTLEAEVPLSQ